MLERKSYLEPDSINTKDKGWFALQYNLLKAVQKTNLSLYLIGEISVKKDVSIFLKRIFPSQKFIDLSKHEMNLFENLYFRPLTKNEIFHLRIRLIPYSDIL